MKGHDTQESVVMFFFWGGVGTREHCVPNCKQTLPTVRYFTIIHVKKTRLFPKKILHLIKNEKFNK